MTAAANRGHGRRRAGARVARVALGERLAGFIYGTIVVLSVIVAGARAYPRDTGRVAVLVAVTCVVFWLAHVYAHALGASVRDGARVSVAEVRSIARREGSIVEAALLPVAALLVGAAGVIPPRAAIWSAFVLGLAVLAAQGLVFARAERLGRVATVAVVAANLALGLALVALKLLLMH